MERLPVDSETRIFLTEPSRLMVKVTSGFGAAGGANAGVDGVLHPVLINGAADGFDVPAIARGEIAATLALTATPPLSGTGRDRSSRWGHSSGRPCRREQRCGAGRGFLFEDFGFLLGGSGFSFSNLGILVASLVGSGGFGWGSSTLRPLVGSTTWESVGLMSGGMGMPALGATEIDFYAGIAAGPTPPQAFAGALGPRRRSKGGR